MITAPIRVGIIGSNYGLAHIAPMRAAGAAVVALCGRDAAKTARLAAHHQIPLATTDLDQLCAAVDAVVVAGPDGLHHDHVLQVLGHGRHLLCEKPLTRTASEAARLVAAARGSDRVCAVAFAYRHIAVLRNLASWLDQRRPPRWLSVSVANSFAAAEGLSDSGPLMGLSGDFGGISHLLDAALWWMNAEPLWVQASMSGRPAHSVALHIGLDNGATIVVNQFAGHEPGIHGHWLLAGDDYEVRLEAEYRPELASWRLSPVRAYQGDQWQQLSPLVVAGPDQPEPWYQGNLGTAHAFLAAIRGEAVARDALVSFSDAARVQQILGAAMVSVEQRRQVFLSELISPPLSRSDS